MKLRPYQNAAVEAIMARLYGIPGVPPSTRTLAVMATGAGKTVVAAHVANRVLDTTGLRVLVMAHREELIRQAYDKFGAVTGHLPAVEKAEYRVDEECMHGKAAVVVASVQTLNTGPDHRRRMCKFDPAEFGLLWLDEAHHATAESYRRVIEYFTAGNPDLKVLGVTATADRADGEALGQVFQSVAFNYDLPEAVADGWLVPVRQAVVEIDGLDISKCKVVGGDLCAAEVEAALLFEKPLHGVAHATIEVACGLPKGALEAWRDLTPPDRADALAARMALAARPPLRTLVFCAGVALAERLAEIINRWHPGAAAHVEGGMPDDVRRKTFADFRHGHLHYLTACMVPTEGYDEPRIECVVMARPTKSRPLYAQMCGRGTRPLEAVAGDLNTAVDAAARQAIIAASGKPHLVVLDFVGNAGRHKLVTTADLLGGVKYDDAVAARAAELAAAAPGAVPTEALLEQAAAEIEEEQAAEAMLADVAADVADAEEATAEAARAEAAARRAGLVGTTHYTVAMVDAYDTADVVPVRQTEATGDPVLPWQIEQLGKFGVLQKTARGYTRRQAAAVLSSLKAKRCTNGQAWKLQNLGYDRAAIAALNFDGAKAAIDAALKAAPVAEVA